MSCPYAAALAPPPAGDCSSVTADGTASAASSGASASGESVSSSPLSSSGDCGRSNDEVMEALTLARTACPAFRDGRGCPFRDATDAGAMRKAMLTVPPSHIGIPDLGTKAAKMGKGDGDGDGDGDGEGGGGGAGGGSGPPSDVSTKFRKALEHVHAVSVSLHHSPQGGGAPSPSGGADGSATTDPASASRFVPFMLDGGCPFKTYYTGGGGAAGTASPGGGGAQRQQQVPFVSAMEEFSLSAIIARMADEESSKAEEEAKEYQAREGSGPKQRPDPAPREAPERDQRRAAETERPKEESEPVVTSDVADSGGSAGRRPSVSISAALQTGTAESHQAAESVHFVRNFVKGIIDHDLYAALVLDLYHVYRTLERLLDVHGPVHFPALHHPDELGRTSSLEDDVEYFHGFGWEDRNPRPSAATADYVARMEDVARTEPILLLSHAYTRYLGDLSGGRILARVARKALNLKGSKDGLRFYDFDRIDNPKKFKDAYRRSLDGLDLTEDQVDRLVAEANVAFVLNMRVFEELDVRGGVDGAAVRPLEEATRYYDRVVERQGEGEGPSAATAAAGGSGVDGPSDAKCPFAYLGGPNPHGKKEKADGGGAAAAASAAKAERTAADVGPTASDASSGGEKEGRCPWPFVFFHDPAMGMRDYQTWVVVGLVLCWFWSSSRAGSGEGLGSVWETLCGGGTAVASVLVPRRDDTGYHHWFVAALLHLVLLLGGYSFVRALSPRLK